MAAGEQQLSKFVDLVRVVPVPGAESAEGELRIVDLPGRVGLRMSGEADLRTKAQLGRALAALDDRVRGHGGEVVLDVGGLSFVSAGAMRAFADFADRIAPCPLVLEHVSQQLARVLEVVWPDRRWVLRR